MTGGELFDRIVAKKNFSELEVAATIRPILDAIRYCHSLGITHGDLKPENIFYESRDDTAAIKISHFGLTEFFKRDLAGKNPYSIEYEAPEILEEKGYSKEVDCWSIGVLLYNLLCGFPPFYGENNEKLFDMIKNCQFNFPSPYWDDVSDVAKDLIRQLLIKDPGQRLNAEQILSHPWIHGDVTP